MKVLTTKSGQVIELMSKKEMIDHLFKGFAIESALEDDDISIFIQYKDKSIAYISASSGVEGKLKKTNIKTVIEFNSMTIACCGDYSIVNQDNSKETYSQKNDHEDKHWIVEEGEVL